MTLYSARLADFVEPMRAKLVGKTVLPRRLPAASSLVRLSAGALKD
jgi:hypothetical protein